MTWVGTAIVVGGAASAAGSMIGANAAKSAANTQAQAALEMQQRLLAAGQQASKQFDPYAAQGTTALANLNANNDYFNHQFGNQDLNTTLAPNYAFQLGQGQAGQNAAANAAGGLIGSNAQQGLQQYTQNYASNAYQNAFSNYQTQRGNIYGMNMGQANLGLAGATGSANAQLGTATNIANLGIGSANAQAAGQIGQANAYQSGLNSLGNMAMYGASMQGNPTNNGGYSSANNLSSLNSPTLTQDIVPSYSGGGFGMQAPTTPLNLSSN